MRSYEQKIFKVLKEPSRRSWNSFCMSSESQPALHNKMTTIEEISDMQVSSLLSSSVVNDMQWVKCAFLLKLSIDVKSYGIASDFSHGLLFNNFLILQCKPVARYMMPPQGWDSYWHCLGIMEGHSFWKRRHAPNSHIFLGHWWLRSETVHCAAWCLSLLLALNFFSS